jgi:hypothetical protein
VEVQGLSYKDVSWSGDNHNVMEPEGSLLDWQQSGQLAVTSLSYFISVSASVTQCHVTCAIVTLPLNNLKAN